MARNVGKPTYLPLAERERQFKQAMADLVKERDG
jgi:hypothetical protein